MAPRRRTQNAVVGEAATTEVVAEDVEETRTTAEIGRVSSLATIAASKGTTLETVSYPEEEHMKRKAVAAVGKTMYYHSA